MTRSRNLGQFVALAVLWGGSFPAIEVGLEAIPPVLFAAIRFDIAGALLVGYAVVSANEWRPRAAEDLLAVAAGGVLFVALGNGLGFVGQQYTTGGVASIVFSLIPLLTAAFAWVLLADERLSSLGFAGIVLGLVGVGILTGPGLRTLRSGAVLGEAIMFVAAVTTALGTVLVRRWSTSLSSATLTAWSMVLGALVLHAGSLAIGEGPPEASLSPAVVLAMAYLGVASSALAYVLYFSMLRRFSALEMNLVTYLTPVVATLTGWLLLDEPVTASMVAGFVVIATGFAVLKRRALVAELRRVETPVDAD